MEKLKNLLEKSGFVFQGSLIYGGLANTWDYGNYGVKLINNIKNEWRKFFLREENIFEIDSSILLNQEVWKTSGHIDNFSDPLIDCKSCKKRYRVDKLIEEVLEIDTSTLLINEMEEKLKKIHCPNCKKKDFTAIRQFNLMFATNQGVVQDNLQTIFLRPETAQGIFINFNNLVRTNRASLPFGVIQYGKAFRNEITPGNFIFRTREFEQMELEYFVFPKESSKAFEFWKTKTMEFLKELGILPEKLHFRNHKDNELAHYSKETSDIEFDYSFGRSELAGISNRTDFDLKNHSQKANEKLQYFVQETKEWIYPAVVEPSIGVARTMLAILESAYCEEVLEDKTTRTVLKLAPKLAPIKLAILPLSNKLKENAKEIFKQLKIHFVDITIDYSGSIGKRYRRQDEIGTPFCLTVDFDSLESKTFTLRNRDSMKQDEKRYTIDEIISKVKGIIY